MYNHAYANTIVRALRLRRVDGSGVASDRVRLAWIMEVVHDVSSGDLTISSSVIFLSCPKNQSEVAESHSLTSLAIIISLYLVLY